MSKIAAGHGGNDHQKASSFMSDTLDKVDKYPSRSISLPSVPFIHCWA